mgnify:CR=1 FL=1
MNTNVRTTSLTAFRDLNVSGTSTNQQKRILNSMDYGVNYSLREIKANANIDINAVSGRVNTLKKNGKLKEAPKRKCTITDRLITPVYKVMITKSSNSNG